MAIKNKRLRVMGFAWYGLKILFYLIGRGKFRMAWNYLFVSLFSRDSGLALLDPFFRRFPRLNPYPWCIEVETSTACNLKCIICEHTYWHEPPKFMTFDQFKHIVDQFPRLKRVGATGIGNAFINPDYLRMLEYLKNRNCYVEIFDSFASLQERDIQALADLGIDKLWVSFEAATKETYEKIRVGARFEQTIANIKRLAELRDKASKPLPQMAFHFIFSKLNIGETLAYVDMVKSLIGDTHKHGTFIFFTALLDFPEVNNLYVQVDEDLKNKVDQRCHELNIFSAWNDNITIDQQVCQCMRWNEPFVLVTGDVQCCCAINEANQRAYQIKHSFGNLLQTHFKDLWYSNVYGNFRRALRHNVFPPICKYCRAYLGKREKE
jgi:MoaA/NifB/PqqE/SkfB family radical SAM enzyme